jgi:(p)ppGpp synthase/HD superfamily hydrolase
MGIWQFKSELEDTAFMYLYPQEYKRLNRRLRQHQNKFRETLDKSQELLQQRMNTDPTLTQQAAKVEVFGRTKEIYSLWHKMETKGEHNLDHIVDVVALRVIISPEAAAQLEEAQPETDRGVWLCYHVLGLVQHLPGFQPVPTRVKDYISFPKPNGYQSLHTALILDGQTIEVQIRTSLMHQVAEFGMASHWAYTDDKRKGNTAELFNTPWLSSIKEWQNDRISSRDFVDSVRRELLGKRVFVFLRNGKILNLARGATAIDAAFQIHTEVGLSMHGVEINGKTVPFCYELQNGDVVSIQTGEGKPATDWMRYAKSRSTRSKLRSYFRDRQKESLREAGEILLMDYLLMHGPLIESQSYLEDDSVLPTTVGEVAKFLPGRTQYTELDEMLISIGKHHDRVMLHRIVSQLFGVPKKILVAADESNRALVPSSVVAAVYERRRSAKDAAQAAASDKPVRPSLSIVSSPYSVEKMLTGIDTPLEYADSEHLCDECLPIHGDEVVGTRPQDSDLITTVHRMGCPRVQRAINRASSEQRLRSLTASIQHKSTPMKPRSRVDSVALRQYKINAGARRTNSSTASKYIYPTTDVPVRLQWSDLDENQTLFLTEVVVHAQDRKLLLADCSEVVSETVEILKTGSASTQEHATLVFLVQVSCLDNLQQLMDRLGQVRSVMSVERRFGSELY